MTDDISAEKIIQQSKTWVKDFIVAHNICPFARKEFERGSIHYEVFHKNEMAETLSRLIEMCQRLDKDSDTETVLFILPDSFSVFNDFLDLLDLANNLLHKQNYEGIYQLASFHPDYCFEGVGADDASHYTNRSPYPMLHIIRETELEKALEKYPNPETIPERNIAYCQELGNETLISILRGCKK